MTRTQRSIYLLGGLALLLGLVHRGPASAQTVDDIFLLSSHVSPNVLIIQDNSTSMNQIEWHPAFDPAAVPDCSYWDNDIDYECSVTLTCGNNITIDAADTADADCWNTRDLFDPAEAPQNTLWSGRYLNWYFSAAADPYVNEIETALHTPAACNKAGSKNRFVDKYRRTRAQMSKQVLLDTLCEAEDKGVRFGQMLFRSPADLALEDPNGGWVIVEIDDPTPAHAADLEAHIGTVKADTWAPLGEALFQAYTFFMSRDTTQIPLGRNGTKFPKYSYRLTDGSFELTESRIAKDPMIAHCQRSFVIIVTDGSPTRDDFDTDPFWTSLGFSNFGGLIGDYYQPVGDEAEIPGDAEESGWYCDDIAKYMHEKDFRPDLQDDQILDVYTIGLSTDAATEVFLQRVADVADGLFFSAKDGEELAAALVNSINDIIEKVTSFTAATVPTSRTAAGEAFFTSYFIPSAKGAFWEGHLRSWQVTATGEILDKNGACALLDPDAGECNNGPFDPDAEPFWDAADRIDPPATRANLKATKLIAGTAQLVNFDTTLTAADMNLAPFATPGSPPDPLPNSPFYPVKGSTAVNEEGLADEIVQFVRGCGFGTGVLTADVDLPQACLPRARRLGDIFHSSPAVVAKPVTLMTESTYQTFKATHATRQRVIFAGANDGFLHAFDAGSWDTSLDPDAYNAGSGDELFAFMPWVVRRNVKNLPIDSPTAREYYVDGPPQAADAWIHTGHHQTTKAASEWKTVLLGGLRQGGGQYYALDVTDPTGGLGPYPRYLWEFPDETDLVANQHIPFFGETWGQPIVTRVKLQFGPGDNNGGEGFERWVAILTGGYATTGDPNHADYDPFATAGRAIYILDLKTGEVLAQKRFDGSTDFCDKGTGATTEEHEMCFAIASMPAVFDLDFDGFADVIYVGDLGGNVWRWAIHALGEDRVNDGSVSPTQPNWPFRRFFQGLVGSPHYKSFFTTPAGAIQNGTLYIALGSGERADIAFVGKSGQDEDNNRLYVITDPDPLESSGPPAGVLAETDLTDLSATASCSAIPGRGYFFLAAEGEKFVSRTNIFAGLVIAASFTPDPTAGLCEPRGDGLLYIFDLDCGEGYFTDGGSPSRSESLGTGMPTDPQISLGVDGTNNVIYIEKSSGELESLEAPDLGLDNGGIIYWREVE